MQNNRMSYRPDCFNIDCDHLADVILRLPTMGRLYFCARHGLRNVKLAPEGLLS
jgi:hypothetical protein